MKAIDFSTVLSEKVKEEYDPGTAPDIPHTASQVHSLLVPILERFKSRIAASSDGSVTGTSNFQVSDSILRGSIRLKGVRRWLAEVLSNLELLKIPSVSPPEPTPEDPTDNKKGTTR